MTRLYDRSGDRKYLNPSERMQFFEVVEGIENPVHKAFCMVLIYTGCRISEVLNLMAGDLDRTEQILLVRTLKQRGTHRMRILPLPSEVLTVLSAVIGENEEEFLFRFSRSTGWRVVKRYMKQAGLNGVKASPKGLRHAFAIDNLARAVPLTTIQKWLGHQGLETTRIYLDHVGKDERELMSRAWPHHSMALPAVMTTSTVLESEVELFEYAELGSRLDSEVNRRIKKRQKQGWIVSSMSPVGHRKGSGSLTLASGMLVAFAREKASAPG